MKRTLAISSLFVGTVIIVACSSKPNPPPATPTTTFDGGGDGAALPPDGGFVMAAPADAGGPVMPPFFTGGGDAGAAPAATMTDQAADLAIDALLAAAAGKNAPKMTEVSVLRGTQKEGDHLVSMVSLEPNKCYTIIGTSLPGMVTQLDLKLYGPPFYTVEAGKSAAADKALPIIAKGAAALCPIAPVAIPYKLDAVSTKGAGRVVVKVYSRAK